MAYIPKTTDRAAWAERNRLAAEYLGRAAQAADADKLVILSQLVRELFDLQVQPRLAFVKSEEDLPAFESELRLVWSLIIIPHLPVSLIEVQMESLRVAEAARRAHWMARAIQSLHPAKSPAKNERKAAVEAYIREVFENTQPPRKITKTDFWKQAGYKTRTEFEKWQRYDKACTKAAEANFSRILRDKPHLKPDHR